MDIDRRLHEAGHQWRQGQGPALPAPKLDTPLQKTSPRRWITGLIPQAASAAVAAMVIAVVVLHDAPASHQVPEGSTSTSSPPSFPTSAPTASTPAQAASTFTGPQPSTAVAISYVAGKGAVVAPTPGWSGACARVVQPRKQIGDRSPIRIQDRAEVTVWAVAYSSSGRLSGRTDRQWEPAHGIRIGEGRPHGGLVRAAPAARSKLLAGTPRCRGI